MTRIRFPRTGISGKSLFAKSLSFFMLSLIVAGQFSSIVNAISPDQAQLFQENINYFDTCGSDNTTPTTQPVTPGTGAPTGTQFPSLDPGAMANAIDTFIAKEQPSSPLKNLGATIVASAKAANVNPFLIVGIADQETSLATADTPQVTEGHAPFNRRATASQPHISIATGLWYKWTSFQASVDSTAPENQNADGGGDIAAYLENQYKSQLDSGDLTTFITAYDSAGDAPAYVTNLNQWMGEMAQDANSGGGADPASEPVNTPAATDSTDTPDTSTDDSGGSACCSSSSSSAPVSTPVDTSGGGNQSAKEVQTEVYDTLVTTGGLDAMHAAAVMGNIAHEGVWDPENVEDITGLPDSKDPSVADPYGYGLIGWTPGSSLTAQIKELGISDPPYLASTQAAVIAGEINGKTPDYYTPDVGKAFMNTKTIEDATTAYQGNANVGGPYLGFERPTDESGTLGARIASAKQFLQEFGGTTPAGGTDTSGSGSSGGSGSCCPPSGDSSTPGATAQGSDSETAIWNYLVGTMQLSSIQAAGIMGNMEQESGFSPTATNPSSGAYGIAQWLGGRLTGLESLASKEGKDKSDITAQLDYLKSELEGSYKSSVLKPIQASNSLEDVTKIWLEYYEVPCTPGSSACDAEMQVRLPNAKAVLQKYGNGDAADSGTPTDSSCGGSTTSGGSSGTAGANGWDLTGANAMVYYGQCDSQWKNYPYGAGKSSICSGGCGITSMSMVVATLADKNQTPKTMADKYGATYHTSGGTSWALWPVAAHDFGLQEKDIGLDFSQAAATVKAGGLVIIAVNPGHFTSEGHVMVIRAVTADGDFLLADPNNAGNKALGRGDTNNTPYSASFLEGQGPEEGDAMNMWAFTK